MNKNKIIKTKTSKYSSKWHRAWGAREIAQKMWGDLKVADSFLYLYRKFGAPCADTNDEYKISYEYSFWYKGLYFILCGTTPEFVYLDCYMPNKYFHLQRARYRKEVRELFDRATKEDILVYPWASPDDVIPSLTKRQQKVAMKIFLEELESSLGEENSKFIRGVTEESSEEDKEKSFELHQILWIYLAEKFWKWAGNDETIYRMFKGEPDLHYLPEVEKIVKDFCRQMLKTMPIRDCDINIQGWK